MLPVIDRIFTRIGASDNLARGRSTFMVEMTETAVILNTATPRSFIVLDEIGRGTATYDGLALAWAVVEHIHAQHARQDAVRDALSRADRAGRAARRRAQSAWCRVKEAGDHIIFLRKVEPGKADRSYGIEVARLAGLPLARDRARARSAEAARAHGARGDRGTGASARTRARCRSSCSSRWATASPSGSAALNLDELRPIEALQLLARIAEGVEAISESRRAS